MQRSTSGTFGEDKPKVLVAAQFLQEQGYPTNDQPVYRSVTVQQNTHSLDSLQLNPRPHGADLAASPYTRQACAADSSVAAYPVPAQKGHMQMDQLAPGMDAPPGAGRPANNMGQLAPGMDAPPGAGGPANNMGQLAPGMDAPPGAGRPANNRRPAPGRRVPRRGDAPLANSLGPANHMPIENPMDNSADRPSRLKTLGHLYNRNTSVVSTAPPQQVIQEIGKMLGAMPDCEVNFKPQNFKCSGSFFHQDRLCSFMISMFVVPANHPNHALAPGTTLVEFQRRAGDAFSFQRIYRLVVAALEEQDLVHYSANGRRMLPTLFAPLPMPPLLDDDDEDGRDEECGEECGYLDFSQDEAVCDNLVTMMRSIYLEPRREASAVLARGTRSRKNARILCKTNGITPTLMMILEKVNDMQIMRNAALILCNMLECATVVAETGLRAKMINILFKVFLRWSGVEHPKHGSKLVSCQIGQALKLVASKGSEVSSKWDVGQSCVRDLTRISRNSPIPEAATLATEVLSMTQR